MDGSQGTGWRIERHKRLRGNSESGKVKLGWMWESMVGERTQGGMTTTKDLCKSPMEVYD